MAVVIPSMLISTVLATQRILVRRRSAVLTPEWRPFRHGTALDSSSTQAHITYMLLVFKNKHAMSQNSNRLERIPLQLTHGHIAASLLQPSKFVSEGRCYATPLFPARATTLQAVFTARCDHQTMHTYFVYNMCLSWAVTGTPVTLSAGSYRNQRYYSVAASYR